MTNKVHSSLPARGPGIGMLLMVLTLKLRLIVPLIWSSVKWAWQVKPLLVGLIGLVAIGAYEVKKNALDRLSKAISGCAVQEGLHANANQTSTFEIERWYEAYLDGFHYLPGWIRFMVDGKQSELDARATQTDSGWIHFGPEPGATAFLGEAHIDSGHVTGDLAAWNFVWVPRFSDLALPWSWHGDAEPEPEKDEARASIRLRFLRASEAFGRYLGMLNDQNPGRTPYVQKLIATGELHLTAAEQARSERPQENALAESVTLRPTRRRRAPVMSVAEKPNRIPGPGELSEPPVVVTATDGLRFYEISPAEAALVLEHLEIDTRERPLIELQPGTEVRRLLTPYRRPAAGHLFDGTYGWVVRAGARMGLIRKGEYEHGTRPKAGPR